MGNISSGIPICEQVESSGVLSNVFDDNFIETSLVSLQRMRQKVAEGLEKKEIWNGNLIQNIISNAESYIKNQRILIVLLGTQKTGKTTMLNALLGQDLIPFSFNSTTPKAEILISVGYHSHPKISIKQCDPQTFVPLEEDVSPSSSINSSLLEFHELSTYINSKISNDTSNSSLPRVQAAFNHSVKVFEILIKSEIFEQYPIEVRHNIRFVDTPGLRLPKSTEILNQPMPFLNCIKSLSKEGSPLIKFYIWVTSLRNGEILQEKKLFEQVCLQLSLRKSDNVESNFFSRSSLNENTSEGQGYSGKLDALESICNVIRFQSSLSESHSNVLLDSIKPCTLRTINDFVHSDESARVPSRVIEFQFEQSEVHYGKQPALNNHHQSSEDDFQLVDEEQVRQDAEELRIRFETISNVRKQKFKRQMMVIVNQQDDSSLFMQGHSFFRKSLQKLPEEKVVSHLESELEKNAIRVWPLVALLNRQLDSVGFGSSSQGFSKAETEIMTKFNSEYKDIFKSFKQEQIFLNCDQAERNQLVELSGFKYFERQIARSIQGLLDFKIMKRRKRIQEIIDKSCSFSSKIILNQAKKNQLDQFILETLPIIHSNHELLIKNHLHDLNTASYKSRSAIVSAIKQIYSDHKLFSFFDKIDAELNSMILEYLRDSVQSLASSMEKGDEIIETNKDIILNELKKIDPLLQEGIKSIITDFKKRSMQKANHAITTNMCMSLQSKFSILSKVLGTSSIVTGISVLLQRMAGKSLIGSGPAGLAVAVGVTAISTVWYVNERQKKLKESQQQILQYLEDVETGQEKINQQLIQSYTEVYKEVIEVIRDYLTGISSTTFDELLSEQNQLRKQDQDLEGAEIKHSTHLFRGFSQGTVTSSSGDSDSERSEEVESISPFNSEHQAHEARNFEKKSIKTNTQYEDASKSSEIDEDLFYSFRSEQANEPEQDNKHE